MDLHPSVLALSKRLLRFLPLPFLFSGLLLWVTLSPDFYPGQPAAWDAAALGLTPPSGADRPIFAACLRGFSALPAFPLPTRLNLFSALCATFCVTLLYRLVARLALFLSAESGGGAEHVDLEESDEPQAQPEEVFLYNLRTLPLAVTGGLIASFVLLFSLPFWAASTRTHAAPFDLLLALAASELLLTSYTSPRLWTQGLSLALSFFLFALGFFETAAFLVLLPAYLFFGLSLLFSSQQRALLLLCLLFAGAAGFLCGTQLFFANTADALSPDVVERFVSCGKAFAAHHYRELRACLPRTGWVLILLQTAVPAIVLLLGASPLLKEERLGRKVAVMLLLTAASLPAVLNLPFSPQFFFPGDSPLPVFGCAAIAAAVALTVVACLQIMRSSGLTSDEPDDLDALDAARQLRLARVVARCLCAVLLLSCLLAPWLSFRHLETGSARFADATARAILTAMGDRPTLITNGLLDDHLLLQAHLLKRPLTLIPARTGTHGSSQSKIEKLIASHPAFDGLNKVRLVNALSVGTARFITEWLTSDSNAVCRTAVFATPDIFAACGYRALPEGLIFTALPRGVPPDVTALAASNRLFFESVAPSLMPRKGESGPIAALRQFLRTRASLAANELGVLLEERNQPEAAFLAYEQAGKLEPMNVCAKVNSYALVHFKGLHPESDARLRRQIMACASSPALKNSSLAEILQTYGTIRQPDFFRQQSMLWSARGLPQIADDKSRKAAELTGGLSLPALADGASAYLLSGDLIKAEACCLAMLDKDPANVSAMALLATLKLKARNTQEALTWLDRATRAGAKEADLRFQNMAALALANSPAEKVHTLLAEATQNAPEDPRYWILLADLLLSQRATKEVEFQVLPALQKALNAQEHFLVHTVRGFLLRKKGTAYYKEARVEFLKALAQNMSLPDVWNALFDVDLTLGDADFMEADAKKQLSVDPEHALANYLLGTIRLTEGKLPESEDFLRRSVARTPTAPACNDLAENLRRQKRLAEAESFARKSLALQENFPSALDTLACILLDRQNADEAYRFAAKAAEICPQKASYQLTLLRVRVKQNNRAEVGNLLKELEDTGAAIPEALQDEIRLMRN